MNIVIQWCSDCQDIRIFKYNMHQDPFYFEGIRMRECEECGRYEEFKFEEA